VAKGWASKNQVLRGKTALLRELGAALEIQETQCLPNVHMVGRTETQFWKEGRVSDTKSAVFRNLERSGSSPGFFPTICIKVGSVAGWVVHAVGQPRSTAITTK